MAKPKGLYANINARKKKGISRSKKKSTITDKAYANMKAGFPKKKKKIKKMHSGGMKMTIGLARGGAKTKMRAGGTKMTKGYARGGAVRRR